MITPKQIKQWLEEVGEEEPQLELIDRAYKQGWKDGYEMKSKECRR